jgi:hypothetical protein
MMEKVEKVNTMDEKTPRRGMKGFIFTLDAIFALVVATVAVSLLLYIHYTPQYATQAASTEAQSLLQSMLQTNMSQAALNVPYARYAVDGYNSSSYTWQQVGQNASLSFSTYGYGPEAPGLLWDFDFPTTIFPSPSADFGVIAVTTKPPGRLYVFNATNGAVILNTTNGAGSGGYETSPMLYYHPGFGYEIITYNSTYYMDAIAPNGIVLWKTLLSAAYENIQAQDGFIEYAGYLLYPYNGTKAQGTASTAMAYANGAWYKEVRNACSTPNKLTDYAFYNAKFTTLWTASNPCGSSGANDGGAYASVSGNTTVVTTGSNIVAFTLGGNQIWQYTLNSQTYPNVAIFNKTIYAETQNGIYSYNLTPTPSQSFSFFTPTISSPSNYIPAATQGIVYAYPAGTNFQAYSALTGNLLWNVSTLDASATYYEITNPAIAYGNVYLGELDYLYAFGTCKSNPQESVLSAVAEMYLNGQGGCAQTILNQSFGFGTGNEGMFINGTYAPSIKALMAGGTKLDNLQNPTPHLPQGNTITVTAWVYPYSVQGTGCYNGVVSYGKAGASQAGNALILVVQSDGYPGVGTMFNDFCPSASGTPSVAFNKWNFIAASLDGGNSATLWVGTESVTGTLSNSIVTTPHVASKTLSIGSTNYAGTRPFNGLISNVQMYNETLSSSQITELYSRGLGGSPLSGANLYAWYPLEGNGNDYFNDSPAFPKYPANTVYSTEPYTPGTLQSAYQVSSATIPLTLNVNGTYKIYNVSVAIWH